MARIFITGSADGLGRATAETLLGDGHEVIVHARSAERLAAIDELIDQGASAVVGDLADQDQTRAGADQVNHAVDPGWVPTRMSGPGAPDDLRLGCT
jgi:NADP-dependent 3-hydroxy acid dehydrogenase YdfG